MNPTPSTSNNEVLDPVFQHSRREAILIFAIWLSALCWSVPYCYFNGYPKVFDPETFATVWGIPSWIFWGIAMPWLVANIITIFLCLFVIKDDDLEPANGSDATA